MDTVDQMRGKFDVARASRRWPLTLFFALMNIVVINATVIYNSNSLTKITRKEFIENIAVELTKPLLEIRIQNARILTGTRQLARKCLGLAEEIPAEDAELRALCAYCPAHRNMKTKSKCVNCTKLICLKSHTIKICSSCYKNTIYVEDAED